MFAVMQEIEQELTAPEQHRNTGKYRRESVNGHGELLGMPHRGRSGCEANDSHISKGLPSTDYDIPTL
jgi:hypothetical protein